MAGANLFVMNRPKEAEMGFKKTFELNSNLPGYREWLGFVYLAQGRSQNALAEIEREPTTWLRLQGYSVVYYALGRKKSRTPLERVNYHVPCRFRVSKSPGFMHFVGKRIKHLSGWKERMCNTMLDWPQLKSILY